MTKPTQSIRRFCLLTAICAPAAILGGPALAAGGAASGTPQGPTTSLEMVMQLYAGGISLGKGDIDAKFTGSPTAGKYHAVSNLQTSGVVNVFWQSEIQATASGRIDGRQFVPEMYDSFYTGHNGRHQEVALTYENGYPARLYANPPYPVKGYEVKPEDKKGTLDPLSALTFILSGAGATPANPCTATAPVFDGKRRYTVSLSKTKDIQIKMDNGLYKGPGAECEIIYKQIAGYSPKVLKDVKFPRIYAWVVPFTTGGRTLAVPVRAWAKSPYGIVAAVATSLKINGATPK